MNRTDSKTPAPQKSNYLAMGSIMAAGIMWGCMGLFNRGIAGLGLGATSVMLIRNMGACILMGLLFLVIDRSIFRVKLRHLPYFVGTGVGSVMLMTLFYFQSQQINSLAVAAILLYTAPAFVVILSAILFKDKITKQKLAALVIAFLGCTFVSGIWSGGLSISPVGLLFGLGSGFVYSLYTIFGHFALRHYQPFTVTFYSFLMAGVGSLFFINTQELALLTASPRGIFLSLCLMFFSTVLPYMFYTKGLNALGDGGKASILASVEPVAASFLGILAFGEPLTLGVILGLVCILISVYILR